MQDFIADQSGVQMAAFDTFLQVSTEFYHYHFFCLKLAKRESQGNSNYIPTIKYSSM